MSDRNKFSRPRPNRSEPYRNPIQPRRPPPATPGHDPRAKDRPVDYGVDLGYQVIDEHIRQGKQAAQRARRGRQSPPSMLFPEASRSGLSDLFLMWFELLQKLPLGDLAPFRRGSSRARGGWTPFFEDEMDEAYRHDEWAAEEDEEWPDVDASDEDMDDSEFAPPPRRHQNRTEHWHQDQHPHEDTEAPFATRDSRARPRVKAALQIASRRPVEVTLDLAPDVSRRSLRILAFQSLDGGTETLSGVEIAVRGDMVVLRMNIADDQHFGRYVGIVLDTESKESLGTVSVTISEG